MKRMWQLHITRMQKTGLEVGEGVSGSDLRAKPNLMKVI